MIFLTMLSLMGCESDAGVTTYTTPPNASITAPANESGFAEGDAISFRGLVDDAQDPSEDLIIIWSSDIDGGLYEGNLSDADGYVEFVTANLSAGNHIITLSVVDSDAEKATDTVKISVTDLVDDPTIEFLRPTAADYGVEGETFQFKAQVFDEQDPPGYLTVVLNSSYDGDVCSPAAGSDGIVSCEVELSVQDKEHLVTYSVTDQEGFTGAATAYFLVYPASAIDHDGDKFSEEQGDCDDDDADIYPGAEEVLNSEDDDCDDKVDEGTAGYDDDGDGMTEIDGDCDDNDPHAYPGAEENCDSVDNDCDTTIDEDTECSDDDGDGYSEDEGDCDDTSSSINPEAAESCNGVDDDCNGTVDDEGASGCAAYYIDSDGDGYGSSSAKGACYCDPTGSYTVTNNDDCYDSSGSANPGQTGYFSTDRGDGSYDYDCDSVESKELSAKASCDLLCLVGFSAGWDGSAPACGVTGQWASTCDILSVCDLVTTPVTQACR
jgi:hypothetical protein